MPCDLKMTVRLDESLEVFNSRTKKAQQHCTVVILMRCNPSNRIVRFGDGGHVAEEKDVTTDTKHQKDRGGQECS